LKEKKIKKGNVSKKTKEKRENSEVEKQVIFL